MAVPGEVGRRFPRPQEFFIEVPLYSPFIIDGATYPDALRIEYCREALEAHCMDCGRESIFRAYAPMPRIGTMHTSVPEDVEDLIHNYPKVTCKEGAAEWIDLCAFAARDRAVEMQFECARDATHTLHFHLRVRSAKLMKVGQYPSLVDLQRQEIAKYRKLLGDMRYAELNRAIGLSAHGIGIGAFVYLRRLFEHLIDLTHAGTCKQDNWDEERFRASRMEDKIRMLKDSLPPLLVEYRKVYNILSKGIHSLTEDECLAHFTSLKLAILLILDEHMSREETKRKAAEAKAALDQLSAKLGGGAPG